MDTSAVVDSAHAAFLARLDLVTAASLDRPTPCEGWDVAELLRHVLGGCRMTVALVEGAEASRAASSFASSSRLEGNELISSCRQGVIEQGAALCGIEDAEATVHFPTGDMPVDRLRSFRIVEMTLHAWDLARAIEADELLPRDAVAFSREGIELMIATVPPKMFSPRSGGIEVPAEDDQARLLVLSGRQP